MDGSQLVQAAAAGHVMVRSGRLKNARRVDVCCGAFEKMMSGCMGYVEELQRRGKVGIDGDRCMHSLEYRK